MRYCEFDIRGRHFRAVPGLFGCMLILCSTEPARGQCDPQPLGRVFATDRATNDNLGSAVAISGDTAIVGAHLDDDAGSGSGSAYVFTHVGNGWIQQQKLTASDAAAGDQFGLTVAISGDTALIGAWQNDEMGTNAGAAYVFTRSGSTWTEQAKLTNPGATHFGSAVALEGNTALIGARSTTAATLHAGSAHVIVRNGTVWVEQATLTASDQGVDDLLGSSVALAGTTALVGAPFDDNAAGEDAGSAYVFDRPPNGWGNMTESTKLTSPDAAAFDEFGFSVAISDDTALIGAKLDDQVLGANAGAGYIFTRSNQLWTHRAKLTARYGAAEDRIGDVVAIRGNTALIGAHRNDSPGLGDAGSAYLFVATDGLWTDMTETVELTPADAVAADAFGISVAISGDIAVIGAVHVDPPGTPNAGAAYFFELGTVDSDGDGAVDLCDLCPDTPPSLAADSSGRPLHDCNQDCLYDGADIQCLVEALLNQ